MPRIIPHRHCPICGKAIDPDKDFCSEDCRKRHETNRKRQRNMYLMFVVLLIIIFVSFFVSSG